MKKIFLFIILLSSLTSYSQNAKKRIQRGNLFLEKIHVREVLDTILWAEEAKIFNQMQTLFKERNLDPDNPKDYEFFQSNLMQQFLFSKMHILDRIRYKYQHYSYEDLGRYINDIDQGKRQQVVYESNLYATIKELLSVELSQIENYTVPGFLDVLVKKHQPVKLKLKHNNRNIKAEDIDFDVIVETNNVDYKQVHILDKKNNQLLKPEGYTYDQIQKITIIYKGHRFDFKPDEKIQNLPKSLREVNSFISRYSYEEIPFWNIEIQEVGHSIGIKLTNVVSVKSVKTIAAPKKRKIIINNNLK